MEFRTPYNYDTDAVSRETGWTGLIFDEKTGEIIKEPSMTKQSFKDECDLNVLLERFAITGQLPDNPRPPMYDDFTGITDFQTAMNAYVQAQQQFMEFPANVRARFNNDPQQMIEFLGNPENRPEAEKLGIVPVPVPPEPPVTPPKGAPAAAAAGVAVQSP